LRSLLTWLLRVVLWALLLLFLLLSGPILMILTGKAEVGTHWASADRSAAGIAPDPALHTEAVVQIYSARAFDWRGAFAVHTWIATKDINADYYHVHEVTRWQGLLSHRSEPDRAWFGNPPTLHADLRGSQAERILAQLPDSITRYPHANTYQAWPGPNSNTFTAWIIRDIPELELELPPHAIGKDYLNGPFWSSTPSGSGYQVSIYGIAGVAIASKEGLEVNLLGLVMGIDPLRPAIKLPGFGRLGITAMHELSE